MSCRTITQILNTTLAVAIFAIAVQAPAPESAVHTRAADTPVAMAELKSRSAFVEIHSTDPEFTALVESAVERFASVHLVLPPLRIYTHPSREGCQGDDGLYQIDQSGARIDLCTRLEHTVLHELAHAWEAHQVSDQTRQAFMDRTGLEVWNDRSVDWEDRGIEAAAQTIAWGLMDVPISRPDRFAGQAYLFELLTGISSPRLPDSGPFGAGGQT